MSFDNLAQMFFNNREKLGDQPAYRYKHDGHWHTINWAEAAGIVNHLPVVWHQWVFHPVTGWD